MLPTSLLVLRNEWKTYLSLHESGENFMHDKQFALEKMSMIKKNITNFGWWRSKKPNYIHSIVRENHNSDNSKPGRPIWVKKLMFKDSIQEAAKWTNHRWAEDRHLFGQLVKNPHILNDTSRYHHNLMIHSQTSSQG